MRKKGLVTYDGSAFGLSFTVEEQQTLVEILIAALTLSGESTVELLGIGYSMTIKPS